MNLNDLDASVVKQSPEITRQIEYIEKNLGDMQQKIVNLEDRLKPVLTPFPDKTALDKESVSAAISPVGDSLRDFARQIERLTYRLSELLNKLEI